MAKLSECIDRARAALAAYDRVADNYRIANSLLTSVTADSPVSLQGLGVTLHFGDGVAIPVPVPKDREQLVDMLTESCNFLGEEISRLVEELTSAASEAKTKCDEARVAYQAAHQAVAPPVGS